ncbi:Putative ABC-type dipeptide/oligopeptide/nickel transport systems, permease component [Vibrio nigripulchritudo SFn27]|uniref:Putative ABC-type dipeptide/oligopeptide/nickel transport systems, permease component n=1 Tax=Vibrio nigripulchritudo TaxID=28173 RepID=U4JW59_9VIBR|nr:ABC transporter permease [Vibrio nigripulchritudo]CCN83812.1 Putative ABC-type dipeptide/oligopeptide/nickel transport systems, permease component [Vibrio nigripulchritudo BLFn1]CCN87180.1 Putative ABC-type dipeptide/oligopeptide/nickel transport systems, permease component [Vibrio nigripulchritudo SFn27]CCN94536.1 Putative ABC-type dipeptide/oligopeptide/nickel transport systems, permease component [Vibrio nigripulchritudo ENn2]CCO40898.1 Putative ABC-type dipeptide/oligopeptide/nickel tran
MIPFIFFRVVGLVATILATSLIVFLVLEVLPGDPAEVMLGVNAQADTLAALRAEMGFDRPLLERYLSWIGGFFIGDLGKSYTYGVPVSELVADRIVVSLPLAILAILLSTILAIPLGVYSAYKHGRTADTVVMGFAQIGVAIPNFWLGLLFILVFSVELRWFPSSGFVGWDTGFWAGIHFLTLPAIALALPQAAILARVTRSSVLETLTEDYIRTARAKGLTRRLALWRHAVRNALIPVITIMGLQFSFLLAGTIIIESVFTLPGLGRLIFQAISQRDLIVVESIIVLLAISVIFVNFVVDVTYGLLDPRLRGGGHG